MRPEKALRLLANLSSDTFKPLNEMRSVVAELIQIAYIEGVLNQQGKSDQYIHTLLDDIRNRIS